MTLLLGAQQRARSGQLSAMATSGWDMLGNVSTVSTNLHYMVLDYFILHLSISFNF